MANKLSEPELLLASQLRAAGIPLDEAVLEDMQVSCQGLSIYHTGDGFDTICDLVDGGMALMVSLAIHNDSLRTVWIRAFRVGIPWWEPRFRWLPYPLGKIPREYTYSLADPWPAGFEPDDVLNHRVGRRGRLGPNDWMEGLLLGRGQESIPNHYQDRQHLVMPVWVYDSRERKFRADVRLGVDREALRARERKLRKPASSLVPRREPLYAKRDRL